MLTREWCYGVGLRSDFRNERCVRTIVHSIGELQLRFGKILRLLMVHREGIGMRFVTLVRWEDVVLQHEANLNENRRVDGDHPNGNYFFVPLSIHVSNRWFERRHFGRHFLQTSCFVKR